MQPTKINARKIKTARRHCRKCNFNTAEIIQYIETVTKLDKNMITNYLQQEEHYVKENSNRY